MSRTFLFLSLVSVLCAPVFALAADVHQYVGRVNHVLDDGSLRMDYRGGQIRVRPEGLDPVAWQGYRQALKERVLGRQVRVEGARWRDGYLLGRVYLDGQPVDSSLLAGHSPVSD